MIKSHIKAALALGTVIATTAVAKAAPRPCFLRGTKLRTADGERNVEHIAVGDELLTAFGQSRPVQWVGRWHVRRGASRAWSKDVRPILIKQSALAPGVPYTDLFVSRGHAMFIDGVLVPAAQLVNGTSITIHDAEDIDELEYFHVKLSSHDVIFAAGAPSETLLKCPDMAGDLPASARVTAEDNDQLEMHCAPVLCKGRRAEISAWGRKLLSPLLGPSKLTLIHNRLKEQAAATGY